MNYIRMSAVALSLGTAMPAMAQDNAADMLPMSQEMRGPSIDALQSTLYDLIALKHAAHQEHWNVVGPDYYQLHVFYEDLYSDVSPFIDMVAERLRALGEPADGRPGAVAENALGSEPAPVETDGPRTISALTSNWSEVSTALYDRIEAASDDPVTQDLLIAVTALIDKQLWQLRVHEETGESATDNQ